MGAFYLIPRQHRGSEYEQKLQKTFSDKGFQQPTELDCDSHQLVYYPKLGMDNQQVWKEKSGSFVVIVGTAWYKNHSLSETGIAALADLNSKNFDAASLTGTFCLIYFNALTKTITCYHDHKGIFRIYTEKNKGVVSSSWLALASASDTAEIDENAIVFNLLTGFNGAADTWYKNIQRVLGKAQLPVEIDYKRCTLSLPSYQFSSFEQAIETSVYLLRSKLQKIKNDVEIKPILGLSSGFDSRLVAAALSKNETPNLTFFTFHKPGDRDPVIAKSIAEQLKVPLLQQETYRPKEPRAQEQVFEAAFRFFDGQSLTMAQYSKPDYTAEFRKNLFGKNVLHVSGVGGELFRNYNHDHRRKISVDEWIKSFLLGGRSLNEFCDDKTAAAFQENITTYLQNELGVKDSMTFDDRKRFYGELFLRDWHGGRNSVENQYSYYYSPFTDPEIIHLSYATAAFQGYGGIFEGKMIAAISPCLGELNSEYGYALGSYPTRTAMDNFIRAMVKLPWLQPVRMQKRKQSAYKPSEWENALLPAFNKIVPGIRQQAVLSSSDRVEPLLSTAYVLNKLTGR
jgi:hypothetical protein